MQQLRSVLLRWISRWLLFACVSLVACSGESEPPLKVATNVWPGYETLYLARSLGLYKREQIRLIEMTSASQVSHALRNGVVDAAGLTLDETLSLMQDKKLGLQVILIMDISDGADMLIARNPIRSLAELDQKRIGVENTATGAVVLDAALQSAGLNTARVRIIPMTVNMHVEAWRNNWVDAMVTFEPVSSQLLAMDGRVLFDSREIPGRIVDVLVVRTDATRTHAKALKQLVAGHFAALEYLSRHTEHAAQLMAPRLAANNPQAVLSQFQGLKLPDLTDNWQWLAGQDPSLIASSSELVNLMLKHQLLTQGANLETLVNPEFLPEPPK